MNLNVKMLKKVNLKLINNKVRRTYFTNSISFNKYSDSVLLPKTNFQQKLVGKKLSDQSKYVYETADFAGLYEWQRDNLKEPEFILHDGPPYANGDPHMGHAINKILKDTINRNQILAGKKVNYIPGWDCHGLPIELKAMSKVKKSSKDNSALFIRKTARDFATNTINKQSEIFQSWGVMGNWKTPYLTYSVPYIKNQLNKFYELYNKKLIYRDVKPVYWSPSSRTALAEAELEYNEKHKSVASVVRFKLANVPVSLQQFLKTSSNEIYALIWTTTPWTLPSNQAICYNPKLSYSFVEVLNESTVYLIASDLIENVSKLIQKELKTLSTFTGDVLQGTTYKFSFNEEEILPFLPGEHATSSKGTGLVHTAPAHGPDDFILALNHKIPVKCIVDEAGRYTTECKEFCGLSVLEEGNVAVINYLQDKILSKDDYIHSYPYDWRTKKPIIIRASQQWFIDTNAIKNRAIKLLEDVKIYPEKSEQIYKNNLISNINKRPYWCISRQRVWGVPIPVFYNKITGHSIITKDLINHLIRLLDEHNTDFWWSLPLSQLFPDYILKELNLKLSEIEKGQDILDIWFDSGVSWSSVLGDEKIADLYLEGVDQFTGWFQSSLLTSVALRDQIPYKKIYVHGFAVDSKGHKMSKSLGNVVDPQEIIHGGKKQPALGVDTLRWWVNCHASQSSTAFITSNILKSSAEEVQKIRNTLRFAVACLNDYTNPIEPNLNEMKIIDRYLLHLLFEFNKEVEVMYENYQFNRLCLTIINFITNPISALYFSIIKDTLYCDLINSPSRRSTQFVLDKILTITSKTLAPIVPHLIEELHMNRAIKTADTFFKSIDKNLIKDEYYQPEVGRIMETLLDVKKNLNKTGNCLDLNVELEVSEKLFNDLQVFKTINEFVEILQISDLKITKSPDLSESNYRISTTKTKHHFCPRCKRYNSLINNNLCNRCESVLESINKIKITA